MAAASASRSPRSGQASLRDGSTLSCRSSVTWRVNGAKRTSKSIVVEAAASTTQEHRQVEPAASSSRRVDTTGVRPPDPASCAHLDNMLCISYSQYCNAS